MVSAAVGWQCPGCAKDGTTVRRLADLDGAASANPPVTMVLIGISVAVFLLGAVLGGDPLGNGSPRVIGDLGVYAAAVDAGEWWRIFTSGFLHFGPIHLGFNMLMLWRLGSFLERRWGAVRFFALFTAALVGGSAGALILSPGTLTGGASGAIFGLMGAAFVCRGTDGSRDPMEASLGGLLVMNLVITFALSNYISVGGHLGGLLVGGLIGVAIRFDRSKHRVVGLGASIGLGAAALIVGLVVASAPLRG